MLHRALNDDVVFGTSAYNGAYDKTQAYRFVCKCIGVPARFIGWLINTTTGVKLAEWDFVAPANSPTTGTPMDVISQPGVVGLGGYTEPLYDDVVISRLDYASGVAISGPSSIDISSDADLTIAPSGGPVLTDTTVTLDDGGKGGSFSPASISFKALDPQSQLATYTPSKPGNVTLTATPTPALGTPSQVVVKVGSTPAPANTYALTLDTATPVVGTPATVTATLVGGSPLAADLVITPSCPVATFDGPITIAAGTTSATCRMTPTAAGSTSIASTHTGAGSITDPSPLAITFNPSTRRMATGYAVILPTSVVVGQPVLGVVVLTGGTDLDGSLTVLLSDPNGTVGGPVTIAPGQSFGTTTYTANTAGVHAVSALHTGGTSVLTDPAPTSVTASTPVINPGGSGLTIQQVQAACAAAIQATPVTVAINNDKLGYGLTTTERSAIDAALVSSHGSGQWTPTDPLATVVSNSTYGPGTAGALIAAIPTPNVIASTVAATPVAIKAGSLNAASFAPGASVPLPATPPSGYVPNVLTPAQMQAACASAITATPVTVGKNNDKAGYGLASTGIDAILVEGNMNARQAMSVVLAASAGVISGSGTGTITIKGANTAATRIVAATDNSGNRSSIQLSLPN